MAANVTTYLKSVSRAGFGSGLASGKISCEVTLGGAYSSANDRAELFMFATPHVFLACGIEVVTPTTNAITVSIGINSDSAGSATTLAGELATNGAAGTILASNVTTNKIVNAATAAGGDNVVVLEVSGDPGAAGVIRVWAIVADPKTT